MNYITNNKLISTLVAVVTAFVLLPTPINAQDSTGIGVSPAMIENDALTRGSTFEQEFVFSRGTPESNAEAVIEMDGDIREWITFDGDNKVTMPEGQQRVQATAVIKVPENAEYKAYTGSATIKLVKTDEAGQVRLEPAVKLGVVLAVTDQRVALVEVRSSEIPNFAKNQPLNLKLKIQNKGNVADSPDEVAIQITDINKNVIKEIKTSAIPKVNPFKTETVNVKMENVELNEGSYFAQLSVFDQNNNIHENLLSFEVTPAVIVDKEEDEEKSGVSDLFSGDNSKVTLVAIGIAVTLLPILLFLLTRKKKNEDKTADTKRSATGKTVDKSKDAVGSNLSKPASVMNQTPSAATPASAKPEPRTDPTLVTNSPPQPSKDPEME